MQTRFIFIYASFDVDNKDNLLHLVFHTQKEKNNYIFTSIKRLCVKLCLNLSRINNLLSGELHNDNRTGCKTLLLVYFGC